MALLVLKQRQNLGLMKKFATRIALPVALCSFILVGCNDSAVVDSDNGGPSASSLSKGPGWYGFDYKFNIIGTKEKSASLDSVNGKRIFVLLNGGQEVCDPYETNPSADLYCDAGDLKGGRSVPGSWATLDKKNKILLTPCDPSDDACDFDILDANGTDADGANLQMPDDVSTRYEVFARALGKPGGSARITPCADETLDADNEVWCSLTSAVLTREKGKPKVENVTDELLFIDIIIDPDVDPELSACLGYPDDPLNPDLEVQVDNIPLFNACFQNYFWNYDNHGLRLLQVWFREVPNV